MLNRRGFLRVSGLGVLAMPLAVEAQPRNPPRIGFLPIGSPSNPYDRAFVEAFRQGLRDVGLVENRDVTIDFIWVTDEAEYPGAVSQLVQRGAKLLLTAGSSASVAAKRHTSTIPIVFAPVGNPVAIGLVESLSRPGGNVTGFSDVLADLSGKYVQFAAEFGKPRAAANYLWHTEWSDGQARFQSTARAAQSLGVELRARGIGDIAEVNDALAAMKKAGALTLIVQPSPFTYRYRVRLIESALNNGLGMICAWPVAGREGALIAYGPDYTDLYRRAASYVDRILKGAKPADLPVQEPTKFELVVNLKTAKALSLTIRPSLLAQADQIVE
jgi:putative ABC transport system substrate-binding protein